MTIEVLIDDKVMKNETFWDFKGKVDYVDQWILMRSPVNILLILMGYWFFVLYLGPQYMKDKPAFKINRTLALYNMAQIGISAYISYIGVELISEQGLINSTCLLQEESITYRIARGFYIYFLAKMTELLDTVFFVLKKNQRQVTFLHVYHHSIMFLLSWSTLKYEPTYNVVFLGTLNSFVHVIMYTYYYLSAFPTLSKYLWWKKYITKMQIIQFVLIFLHAAVKYCFTGCPPSYTLLASIIFNVFLITCLFINFYVNSYTKNK